jgi:hypothetical protein
MIYLQAVVQHKVVPTPYKILSGTLWRRLLLAPDGGGEAADGIGPVQLPQVESQSDDPLAFRRYHTPIAARFSSGRWSARRHINSTTATLLAWDQPVLDFHSFFARVCGTVFVFFPHSRQTCRLDFVQFSARYWSPGGCLAFVWPSWHLPHERKWGQTLTLRDSHMASKFVGLPTARRAYSSPTQDSGQPRDS